MRPEIEVVEKLNLTQSLRWQLLKISPYIKAQVKYEVRLLEWILELEEGEE